MDVTIHRSRTKAIVTGVSDKGQDWLRKNHLHFKEGEDTIINVDYAMDLAEHLQKAGLDVDVK